MPLRLYRAGLPACCEPPARPVRGALPPAEALTRVHSAPKRTQVVPEASLQQPWAQLPVTLRSRRLPHVALSVELVRLGFYAPPSRLPFLTLPPPAACSPHGSQGTAAGLKSLVFEEHMLLDPNVIADEGTVAAAAVDGSYDGSSLNFWPPLPQQQHVAYAGQRQQVAGVAWASPPAPGAGWQRASASGGLGGGEGGAASPGPGLGLGQRGGAVAAHSSSSWSVPHATATAAGGSAVPSGGGVAGVLRRGAVPGAPRWVAGAAGTGTASRAATSAGAGAGAGGGGVTAGGSGCDGELGEDENLRRISGLLVQEW